MAENKIVKAETPVVAQTASQSPTTGTSQPVAQTQAPAQTTTATNTINASNNQSNADYINSVYNQHLGRNADTSGAEYWNNQLSSGAVNREQMANLVSGSDEAYIRQVYQNMLGRNPDEAGASYWADQLGSGSVTRDQMEQMISNSREKKTNDIMGSLPQYNAPKINIPSVSGSVTAMKPSIDLPAFNERMEGQIDELYAMAQENALAALKNAYDINLANAEYEKGKISPQYQDAMNQAAAENARQSRNLNMQAAANGLNTGAGSQMQLAQSVANQQVQGQLSVAEQQALEEATRNILNLKTKYQNDIAEAIAENNYQKAAALLAEYQEQFNRQMSVDTLAFQMAAHADQMNAQYAQMAQQAALAQAQMDYQAQQDALDYEKWKQNYANSLLQQEYENQFRQSQLDYSMSQDQLDRDWKQRQWDYTTGADAAETLAKFGDYSGYVKLGLMTPEQAAEASRQFLVMNPQFATQAVLDEGGGGGYGGYYDYDGGGGNPTPSVSFRDIVDFANANRLDTDTNPYTRGQTLYTTEQAIADLQELQKAGVAGADKALYQAQIGKNWEDEDARQGAEQRARLQALAAANQVVTPQTQTQPESTSNNSTLDNILAIYSKYNPQLR